MEYFLMILVPLLGPAIASFFSVLVMRKNRSSLQLAERSACDHCKHELKWYELIPIVSFVIQRGRCRNCKEAIDVRIFFGELLGLLLYLLLAFGTFQLFQDTAVSSNQALGFFLIHFTILTPLFYLALYDLFWMAIPTMIAGYLTLWTILANVAVLVIRFVISSPLENIELGRLDNLIMGIVFGGFIYLLVKVTKEKGIGEGDIFIATLIGLAVGWPETISAFYVMLFSATAVGVILAVIKRKYKGLRVPLVPFMTIGYIVAVFWGQDLFNILFFALS